jgi:hypothetical protein
MTPAGKLQEHLKRRVQGSGGQYRAAQWMGRKGCPDCFVWWDWPNAAFIEVKADRDVLSALQRREIYEYMQPRGVPVFIARTVEEIDDIVEKVRKGIAT